MKEFLWFRPRRELEFHSSRNAHREVVVRRQFWRCPFVLKRFLHDLAAAVHADFCWSTSKAARELLSALHRHVLDLAKYAGLKPGTFFAKGGAIHFRCAFQGRSWRVWLSLSDALKFAC